MMRYSAKQLFRQCEISTDNVIYTLVKLPTTHFRDASHLVNTHNLPFSAIMLDKHELTLLISTELWDNVKNQLPSAEQAGAFHLITFECVLTLDVVGFLAVVSDILAQANIPILAFSAFSRDHIFVATEHFQKAWQSLKMAQTNDETDE